MQIPVGYNKQRAAQLMEKYDLDAMLVTAPLNVWYTTGLPMLHSAANPILEALSNKYPNFGLIHRDGKVTVFHWVAFMEESVEAFCWADDSVALFSKDMVADTLAGELEDRGLAGKRLGIETDAPVYVLDALTESDLDLQVQRCDDVLNELRLVKSAEELARLARAAEITQLVLDKCLGFLKEGVTDLELIKFARDEMLKAGADDWNHFTIRFGGSDPEAPGTGRALRRGEIVRLDLGLVYKGYVSDLNIHAVVGQADDEAKGIMEGLVQLQRACEENVRPGLNMIELGEIVCDWYDENVSYGSAFLLGHSIGLQVEDFHMFGTVGGADMVFEENMVFEIETWENYNNALIGVEDIYVVTAEGCKKLSSLTPGIREIG